MKLLLIAAVLLFLSGEIFAQTRTCAECGKLIEGHAIEADGRYFHSNHFICAYCGKVIKSEFRKLNGKYYHTRCARNHVLPVCDVCGRPLEGKYFQDLYNNKYHAGHLDEIKRCDNCDRMICSNITGGGKSFDDGRSLCNICLKSAVKSNSTYQFLLNKVSSKLKGMGVNINMKNVTIHPVDRIGLREAAGEAYHNNTKGFCKIITETTDFMGSREVSTDYQIFVLNKIPSIYVESTLAHELMHVWLSQETKNDHTQDLTEGSCHFMSYKYLLLVNTETSRRIADFLLKDSNPVYGGGLRKVLNKFGNKYIVQLLNFLKDNKSL